jgi:peptidoglycan glycosyltransferase
MWRDPWISRSTDSIQLAQGRENIARALWSISSGGLVGQGIGQGCPDDIEAVESDFIFAAIAEELGWLGGATVVSLLLVLAVTGFQLAHLRDDALAKTLCCGLGAIIAIQSALTIGGNLGLWPLTGITLPFLSYGRSSLLLSFLVLGLMIGLAPRQRQGLEERPFPWGERVNLSMARLQLGVCLVFALLIGKAARLQFPGVRNAIMTRVHLQDAGSTPLTNPRWDGQRLISTHIVRGSLLDRHGAILVESTPRGRVFHDPALSSLLGLREKGQTVGLERSLQGPLMGQWEAPGGHFRWLRVMDERRGFDVKLTLDHKLQKRADELLSGQRFRGCMVGIEPASGKILFAASNPPPKNLQEWRASYDSSGPAFATPPSIYRTRYEPGSTFKTLTAAAALENSAVHAGDYFECENGYFPPGGGEINDHHQVSHGEVSLSRAMAVSCNQTFAQVGVDLGWKRFWDFGTAAGLSTSWSLLPTEWRSRQARFWPETVAGQLTAFDENPGSRSADAALARSAIGQEDVRATPLYLAAWTAAIANGGEFVPPTLVTTVSDSLGRTVATAPPARGIRIMRQSTARALTIMMERVVTDQRGTGRAASVRGVRVAAKTGTPQLGVQGRGGRNNALFIAFAPVEKPRIAIAVVVEGQSDGGATCGPLAAEMMRAVCR